MRRRAVLLAMTSATTCVACSTLPLPRQGPGASLNLATVAYVNDAKHEVSDATRVMLTRDRERIEETQQQLEGQLASSEQRVAELGSELEALSGTVSELGRDMREQAETFGRLAERLRESSERLDAAMAALPTETLREFERALELYLARRETASDERPLREMSSQRAADGEGGAAPTAGAAGP